jgi:hypothetical protein
MKNISNKFCIRWSLLFCFFCWLLFLSAIVSASEKCNVEQILLQGGLFELGSRTSLFQDSRPVHEVRIEDFRIANFETSAVDFFVPWQKQQSQLPMFQNWLSESPQSGLHELAENPGKERFCFPIQRVHLGVIFVLQDIFPTLKRLLTKTAASKKNKTKDSIECRTCLKYFSFLYGITFIVALSKKLQQEQFQEIWLSQKEITEKSAKGFRFLNFNLYSSSSIFKSNTSPDCAMDIAYPLNRRFL